MPVLHADRLQPFRRDGHDAGSAFRLVGRLGSDGLFRRSRFLRILLVHARHLHAGHVVLFGISRQEDRRRQHQPRDASRQEHEEHAGPEESESAHDPGFLSDPSNGPPVTASRRARAFS